MTKEFSSKLIKETKVELDRTSYYVYQTANGDVIWPAINFINYVINDRDSVSTIATYRQAIRSLFCYLANNNQDWLDMNDRMLIMYAKWQLNQSVNEPRWRGDINATKRNINHDYLMPIYEFYFWMQRQRSHPDLLGVQPDQGLQFQITSALPLRDKAAFKKDGLGKKLLYPTLFSNCGENDNRTKQTAEDWELEQLKDYICTHFDGYERASLLLMVRIGDQTGSRPIALSSYIRLQFRKGIVEPELMNTNKAVLEVTPRKQKGGNTMPVKFPFPLVNGVISFIENDLHFFIEKTGFKHHNGHLFLNPKNGKPLKPDQITKIFSRITKDLGWPKGKSYYSLRHRYANEQMDLQASINDELGFTKEENAVALQVSQNMTQKNKKTLIKEYLESRTRHGYKTKVYQQAELIQELQIQKEEQSLEIQRVMEVAEKQRKLIKQLLQKVEFLKKSK